MHYFRYVKRLGVLAALFYCTSLQGDPQLDIPDCEIVPRTSIAVVQCCEPCGVVFLEAGYMYCTAYQSGLSCGFGTIEVDDILNEDGSVFSSTRGEDKDFPQKWNSAYHAGFGTFFQGRCWDVAAYGTQLNFKNSQTLHDEIYDSLEAQYDIVRGHRKWKLDFTTVDLVFSRDYLVCSSLNLTPFVGLRGASIKQKLKSYASHDEFSFGVEALVTEFKHSHQKFLGGGPLLGLEWNWEFGWGFGLYGSLDAAVLYGEYKVHVHNVFTLGNDKSVCSKTKHIHGYPFAADAAIGIRKVCSICNCFSFIVQIGWESHRYFDQNKMGSSGDLCIDGGVASLALAF